MNSFQKLKYSVKYDLVKRLPYNRGFCPICENETIFVEYGTWLRDNYRCHRCNSIPRNRALIQAMNLFYPHWKDFIVHESSPDGILSEYLEKSCSNYSSSHYYPGVPRGNYVGRFRSEDVSALTFDDNSFDLFITSDVFEHIMEPENAFKEIARVLKPGGAHIFTMPWYPKNKRTIRRAKLDNEKVVFLEEPIYHGNPIAEEGSLVTFDWGLDFPEFIYATSKMYTTIYLEKNRGRGIDGEFLEVFKSIKSA